MHNKAMPMTQKEVSGRCAIAEAFYRSVAVSGNHEGEYRLGKQDAIPPPESVWCKRLARESRSCWPQRCREPVNVRKITKAI